MSFVAANVLDLVGNTPLLKIPSLSHLTGCEIYVKCEFLNPGGSVKDRAAKFMVEEALAKGLLKKGMSIVEGTAGNTGIGLALAARQKGLKATIVMPKGQTPEKERMISLYGAELITVPAVPFANENHFYHTAKRMAAEAPEKFWWADQFNNLANFRAHYEGTGPEIWQALGGDVTAFISSSGTGGTLAGVSRYLKDQNTKVGTYLVDPAGSGLHSYLKTGEFKSQGSSITEGIGIMRLVDNFREAKIDDSMTLPDQNLVSISRHVRDHDGILLGSSSALNVAAAFELAKKFGKGRVVTIACDLGERSASKLYNDEFLRAQGLDPEGKVIF